MPRTLVLDGPRRLRLSEQPSRLLRPGEIRLRARLSGISHGTELSLYRGTSAFTDKVFDRGLRAFVAPHAGSANTYPVMLGYEMASEVVEVAPDVTARVRHGMRPLGLGAQQLLVLRQLQAMGQSGQAERVIKQIWSTHHLAFSSCCGLSRWQGSVKVAVCTHVRVCLPPELPSDLDQRRHVALARDGGLGRVDESRR